MNDEGSVCKKCVSSEIRILEVTSKKADKITELTREQISEFIFKATSNSDSFNQLIEVILNSLIQHERSMYLDATADSGNGFRPRRFCYRHNEFHLKGSRTRQA